MSFKTPFPRKKEELARALLVTRVEKLKPFPIYAPRREVTAGRINILVPIFAHLDEHISRINSQQWN